MCSRPPSTKPNAHPQNEEYYTVAIHNPLTGTDGHFSRWQFIIAARSTRTELYADWVRRAHWVEALANWKHTARLRHGESVGSYCRDVVEGEESPSECAIVCAHVVGDRGVRRKCAHGLRVQSSIAKSEAFVLIDQATKSVKELMVELLEMVEWGLCSACLMMSLTIFSSPVGLRTLKPWLVRPATESDFTSLQPTFFFSFSLPPRTKPVRRGCSVTLYVLLLLFSFHSLHHVSHFHVALHSLNRLKDNQESRQRFQTHKRRSTPRSLALISGYIWWRILFQCYRWEDHAMKLVALVDGRQEKLPDYRKIRRQSNATSQASSSCLQLPNRKQDNSLHARKPRETLRGKEKRRTPRWICWKTFAEGIEERDASSSTPTAGSDLTHEVVEEQFLYEKLPSFVTDAGGDILAKDSKSKEGTTLPKDPTVMFVRRPKNNTSQV